MSGFCLTRLPGLLGLHHGHEVARQPEVLHQVVPRRQYLLVRQMHSLKEEVCTSSSSEASVCSACIAVLDTGSVAHCILVFFLVFFFQKPFASDQS